MRSPATLARFKVPLTAQEIELLQLDFPGGPQEGDRNDSVPISELRVRIRERARFTTLDLDPVTAARLGEFLCRWARAQHPQSVAAFDETCAQDCARATADG
jgi:hypothetical protein